MKIMASEIVGKNAISMQSGKNLHDIICQPIVAGEKVCIDFEGVELFASPFFNASIGLLLRDISLDDLKARLEVKNISEVGRQLLNHVIANAINFFSETGKTAEALKAINKNPDDQ